MKWWLITLLLLCSGQVLAATITGTTYTYELQVAKYSLLQIDTVPPQRLLLANGTYELEVPEGTYRMQATYTSQGRTYEDELTVTVKDGGTYSYDFILFPAESNGTQQLPVLDADIDVPQERQSVNIGWIPAVVLLIALILLAVVLSRKRWWHKAAEAEKPSKTEAAAESKTEEKVLPADLESIVAVLKSEGGRTTQKELRKHIPCSEAKMSMMLTELEHKGKIERIKKGRGNLIVLK